MESPVEVTPLRHYPPIAEVTLGSMGLILIGGIYMASRLPRRAPLLFPIACLVVSGCLLLGSVVAIARLREFAWDTFFQVGKWSLLAYAVISGMLEYVFIRDDTRGSSLVLTTLMLVVFALDVPLLFAFSVAKYQEPRGRRRHR